MVARSTEIARRDLGVVSKSRVIYGYAGISCVLDYWMQDSYIDRVIGKLDNK